MTMTDTILFVKETKTCHYVMVIHTPRLCSEPGFKTRLEQRREAVIQCREIVDDDQIPTVEGTQAQSEEKSGLVQAESRPFARPQRVPVIAPPKLELQNQQAADKQAGQSTSTSDVLRKALEALLASNSLHDIPVAGGGAGTGAGRGEGGTGAGGNPNIQVLPGGEGEFWVEFIDAEAGLEDFQERVEDFLKNANGKLQRIEEALRAAGHDINKPLPSSGGESGEEEEDDNGENQQQRGRRHGQEL